MFDKSFYPTPKEIARKITRGINDGHLVLEPSAGKGDIVDTINRNKQNSPKIFCIEKNFELQAILREKGYPVIHNDFLSYNPDMIYDYIIMNPPFDHGAKHLLKAIEIAKGAEIRCLLNSETLQNPCTAERQLLAKRLKDYEATIEKLGQVFRISERNTNVDVTYIIIQTEKKIRQFQFKGQVDCKTFDLDNINNNQIAKIDIFKNYEERYNATIKAIEYFVNSVNEIKYYAQGLLDGEYGYMDIERIIKESYHKNEKIYYNNMVERFRTAAWANVFNKTKLKNFVTQRVIQDFNDYQKEYGAMAFTAENIEHFFHDLFQNRENILNNCVVEAFDLMTKYHKENRCYVEGWKTNDAWKVNKKVILPQMCDPYRYNFNYIDLSYTAKQKLDDIEKALCFVAGIKFEDINSISYQCDKQDKYYGQLYSSRFFDWRVFKKGTIHLSFNDEYIYQQFNIIACKGKNWLPGND